KVREGEERATRATKPSLPSGVNRRRITFLLGKEPSMIPASRRALGALLAIVFLAVPAVGQPEIPRTPAGKVFAAWLAAFNSADAAQIRAFDAAYPRQGGSPPPVEDRLQFREATGGFTLVRVEKNEPL